MLFRNFNVRFWLVFAAIALLFIGGVSDSFGQGGCPPVAFGVPGNIRVTYNPDNTANASLKTHVTNVTDDVGCLGIFFHWRHRVWSSHNLCV